MEDPLPVPLDGDSAKAQRGAAAVAVTSRADAGLTDTLENAEVLTSEAWAKAVEAGRWPSQVRPFTRNRRHVLRKLLK